MGMVLADTQRWQVEAHELAAPVEHIGTCAAAPAVFHNSDGRSVCVEVARVGVEGVALRALRAALAPRDYHDAVARLVVLLTAVRGAAWYGVAYEDEEDLTDVQGDPCPGVHDLLTAVGGAAEDCDGYDVVWRAVNHDTRAALTYVVRFLEVEIRRLREGVGPGVLWRVAPRDPWDADGAAAAVHDASGNATHFGIAYEPPAHAHLDAYEAFASTQTSIAAAYAREETPADSGIAGDLLWLWCLGWVVDWCMAVVRGGHADAGLWRRAMRLCGEALEQVHALQDRVRGAGAEAPEDLHENLLRMWRCGAAAPRGRDGGGRDACGTTADAVQGLPLMHDYPTELPVHHWLALLEYTRRPPRAGTVAKATRADPSVLINTGRSCWLNSVLTSLYHTPPVRNAVLAWRSDPAKPSRARNVWAHLQRLFAFMGEESQNQYLYNESVRAALRRCMAGGSSADEGDADADADVRASGLECSDANELLTVLPDMLGVGEMFVVRTRRVAEADGVAGAEATADESATDAEEYPLMVHAGTGGARTTAANTGTPLPKSILRALEPDDGSALQVLTHLPEVLVVSVRRAAWDAQRGRAVTSTARVEPTPQLDMGCFTHDSAAAALRRTIARLEQELREVRGYDAGAALRVDPFPLPQALRDGVSDADLAALHAAAATLREKALHVAAVRKDILAARATQLADAYTQLSARGAQLADENPNTRYTLAACICHSAGAFGGGHYWAFVRRGDTWFRCDDRTTYDRPLPAYKAVLWDAVAEEAAVAGCCYIYTRTADSARSPAVPQGILQRVLEANARLADAAEADAEGGPGWDEDEGAWEEYTEMSSASFECEVHNAPA